MKIWNSSEEKIRFVLSLIFIIGLILLIIYGHYLSAVTWLFGYCIGWNIGWMKAK